jgi:UDP-galactopyranose mutase
MPLHGERPIVLCLSHLRWNFVYQRPQHLLTRFAASHRVFYFEEPLPSEDGNLSLDRYVTPDGVTVLTPRLPVALGSTQAQEMQRQLVDSWRQAEGEQDLTLWYYTPMSLAFTDHLPCILLVYDCMDELSAFKNSPAEMVQWERRLLARADVVFTGGYSLYKVKRGMHPNVHAFPSSVDIAHFAQARGPLPEPADQQIIPTPRIGFYGVIDERFDAPLLEQLARARPQWHFVLIGPVVKVDPASLPSHSNIHYLGPKAYADLPAYLCGWDVAMMPFALNEATRYISPTKTPEYLAAGRPVVSTPIPDVVRAYGSSQVVRIAHDVETFAAAIQACLDDASDPGALEHHCDIALGGMSWDQTWRGMHAVMVRARRRHSLAEERMLRPTLDTSLISAVSSGAASRAPQSRGLDQTNYDFLVVGAGLAGSVLAERLAAGMGKRVLVVDKRSHIGGNTYDELNADGILVHRYGPHIFHTNSNKVVNYLSRFTEWRPYEHRVLASVDEKLVPMPINLKTLALLYGRSFTAEQATAFLAHRAESVSSILTSEDVVVSKVGRELYEKFFRGYTRKQWGLDPSELDASVAARVPTRTSDDDRYFTDDFQAMPRQGYTAMFRRMLDHPNIDIVLGTAFDQIRDSISYDRLVFTGPIDQYFDYRFGALPYRSLQFEHKTLPMERFQPAAVVNYPSEAVRHTRITEYKYLTGQQHAKTSISYEFPCDEGDPYYPIPRPENAARFRRYQALADETPGVVFAGRLASYRYYNMDQVVAQALAAYARLVEQETAPDAPSLRQMAG